MINTQTLYSLRDISIIPQTSTNIESRSECNPYVTSIEGKFKTLPIIAAPMSCVFSDGKTYEDFWNSWINCIIPRTVEIKKRLELMEKVFCAFSLSEATDILEFPIPLGSKYYVLLDMSLTLQIHLYSSHQIPLNLHFFQFSLFRLPNPLPYLERGIVSALQP